MRTVPSLVTRVARAVIALITVWCLGCSAFDPVIEQLLGRGAGMACMNADGSDTGRATSSAESSRTVASPRAGADGSTRTLVTAQDRSGDACGCQSCNAASPEPLVVPSRLIGLPQQHAAEPHALLGVGREPLVPPPQRAL